MKNFYFILTAILFFDCAANATNEITDDNHKWAKSLTNQETILIIKVIEFDTNKSKWKGVVVAILKGKNDNHDGANFEFPGLELEFSRNDCVILAYTKDKSGAIISTVRIKETVENYQKVVSYLMSRKE